MLCKVDDDKLFFTGVEPHIYTLSAEKKYSGSGDGLRQPSLAILLLHRIPRHITASRSPCLGSKPATRI